MYNTPKATPCRTDKSRTLKKKSKKKATVTFAKKYSFKQFLLPWKFLFNQIPIESLQLFILTNFEVGL